VQRHAAAGSWTRHSPLKEWPSALANQWAAHGVQVNAIAPGYMATDLTQALQMTRYGRGRFWSEFPPADGALPKMLPAPQSFFRPPPAITSADMSLWLMVDGWRVELHFRVTSNSPPVHRISHRPAFLSRTMVVTIQALLHAQLQQNPVRFEEN